MNEQRRIEQRRLEKKLYTTMKATAEKYRLFAPGDRILVGVSGGKDSYTLLHLLDLLRPRLPFPIDIVAVHLDQMQPGYDGAPLREYLEARGGEFEILREDTYGVVIDHVEEGGTYCSLCSRLRRGILYSAAERLGCNKIALGHHRDDTLETFMMNLFYSGKLQAMPARYRTDDGRFEVIRPLIECPEERIIQFSELMNFPILPCNLCGSQDGLKRDKMTALLDELEHSIPNVRSVMLAALSNVRPSHLLDPEVEAVWAKRDPSIRPTEAAPRKAHAKALPIVSGGLALPIKADGNTQGH